MTEIQANLQRVRERIARAAERAGRRAQDVLLVGVSKTVDGGRIPPAIAGGGRLLGAAAGPTQVKGGGLVATPPGAKAPEDAGAWSRARRKVGEKQGPRELSRGMGGDLEAPIGGGATLVRVGTAIFGARPP